MTFILMRAVLGSHKNMSKKGSGVGILLQRYQDRLEKPKKGEINANLGEESWG
jgi:hypothetical protein